MVLFFMLSLSHAHVQGLSNWSWRVYYCYWAAMHTAAKTAVHCSCSMQVSQLAHILAPLIIIRLQQQVLYECPVVVVVMVLQVCNST